MKKLLDYINGLTKGQRAVFFLACETTEGYLRKACSVEQRLSADLCMLIEEASGRAVVCEDLLPERNWAFIRSGVIREANSKSMTKA